MLLDDEITYWRNSMRAMLNLISAKKEYLDLLSNYDFEGLKEAIFNGKGAIFIYLKEKRVPLDQADLKYALFLILLKSFKEINDSNKEYFYKLYDTVFINCLNSIPAQIIQEVTKLNNISIPVKYFEEILPYVPVLILSKSSIPLTVNYIVDENMLRDSNILKKCIGLAYLNNNLKAVNIVFPKNYKFPKVLDFTKFSDDDWKDIDNLNIIFHAEKNENNDIRFPFELQYRPEDEEYVDKILKPIL